MASTSGGGHDGKLARVLRSEEKLFRCRTEKKIGDVSQEDLFV